jgi:hypothetical protein
MTRTSSVTHFVAISDRSQPLKAQEGILIEVPGKRGDTPQNRAKALEIAHQMWQRGEIEADKFPDGLGAENLVYVPPDSLPEQLPQASPKLEQMPPIVQGAQEIVELTKLQLEVQQLAQEAEVYLPIIQAVLERTRPLTIKEKELVQDKRFAKTLERLAATIAKQEQYREKGVKYGQLILNAITWQLNKGIKAPTQAKKLSRSQKVTSKVAREAAPKSRVRRTKSS